MRRPLRPLLLLPLALLPALLGACRPAAPEAAPPVPLATAADSLAWRIVSATGTPEAWARVPYLRMDFRSTAPGDTAAPRPPRRHLWDRRTGDYRLELARPDSQIVVLMNVAAEDVIRRRAGRVFVNGAPMTDTTAIRTWIDRAHEAHINDTYWLLAPAKLFDPGVTRALDADSSARAGTPVLRISFADVGLTPGDRYWLTADPATGRLAAWQFHLEGADAPGPRIRWDRWTAFATPAGDTLRLAPDHVFPTGRILHTDAIAFPEAVPPNVFTDASVAMP